MFLEVPKRDTKVPKVTNSLEKALFDLELEDSARKGIIFINLTCNSIEKKS